MVYDKDLYFVFSKVAIHDDGIIIKLDKDPYVIGYVVPIPMIQN